MVVQNGVLHHQEKKKKSGFYRALPQVIAVTVKNILLMVYGMTLGFPTILIPRLTDPSEPFQLDAEGISWISSINLIIVPLGCILSGPVTQPLGRKRSMQLVNIPFIAAWLTLYFSNHVWQVFFGLALTGLTGGLLEAPVLTYVAEVTQPHLRGMLSSTSSMAIIVGILVQFLLGKFLPWRTVAAANLFLPALAFLALFFIPESPHWLISKNRLLDARKSLAWLRGWTTLEEIEGEFKEVYKAIGTDAGGIDNPAFEDKTKTPVPRRLPSKLEVLRKLTERTFLLPFGTICFIFLTGHFSGMTPLQTYAIPIFITLKTPVDKYYATVLLGSVELLGAIICVISVHFSGKRLLNSISMIGAGICFFIVATYAYCQDIHYLNIAPTNVTTLNATGVSNSTLPEVDNNPFSWIPMACLIGAAFLTHICNRTLPWILIGELYPNDIRAIASGLSGAVGYVFSFSANKLFLSIVATFTLPGTFWFFGCVGFFGSLVLYFILPETEGKPLPEITDHYAGKLKLGNDVRRRKKKRTSVEAGNVNQAYSTNEYKHENDNNLESKF